MSIIKENTFGEEFAWNGWRLLNKQYNAFFNFLWSMCRTQQKQFWQTSKPSKWNRKEEGSPTLGTILLWSRKSIRNSVRSISLSDIYFDQAFIIIWMDNFWIQNFWHVQLSISFRREDRSESFAFLMSLLLLGFEEIGLLWWTYVCLVGATAYNILKDMNVI